MLGRIELLILLALGLLGYVVFRMYRRGGRSSGAARDGGDDSAPRCGRCQYIVRGVPTFTCPECGSDLREVGILTPAMRTSAGPAPWVLAWSLALLIVAVPGTSILMQLLPLWRDYQLQRVIFVQDENLNATVRATASRQGFGWARDGGAEAPPPDRLTLSDDQKGPGNELVAELPSGAYRFNDAAGRPVRRPSGFGPTAIAEWLDAQGASAGGATPTQVRDRAADLDTAIREMPSARGRFTRLGQSGRNPIGVVTAHPAFGSSTPAAWNSLMIVLGWIGLWWLGVTRILKRHRRSGAAAAARNSAGDPVPPVLS